MSEIVCPYWEKDQGEERKPCKHFRPKKYCSYVHPHFKSINDPIRTNPFFLCIEKLVRKPVMSFSVLETYAACKRKFYFRNILGIETIVKPIALELGGVAGKILGYIHNAQDPKTAKTIQDRIIESANRKIRETAGRPKSGQEYLKLYGAMLGYVDTIKVHQGKITELGMPEKYFEIDMGDFILQGYHDVVLSEPGFLAGENTLEFKYCASHDYYDRFTTYLQVGMYLFSSKSIDCVLLRTIKKPTLRLTKTETGSDFVTRVRLHFVHNKQDYINNQTFRITEYEEENIFGLLREAVQEMKGKILSVKNRRPKGIHTRLMEAFYQNRQACFAYGKPCEFKDICSTDVIGSNYQKRILSKKPRKET